MEIDITRLFADQIDLFPYSHSIAEGGQNAGANAWQSAKEEAATAPFLTEPGQLATFRDHMRGFGAWDDDEMAAWSDVECNALFLQLVSGDIRSSPVEGCTLADADWHAWEDWAKDQGGSFYPNDIDNPTSVWYYLGS